MNRDENAFTVDDWRRATDEVIKLSERVEAAVPQKREDDQPQQERQQRSK